MEYLGRLRCRCTTPVQLLYNYTYSATVLLLIVHTTCVLHQNVPINNWHKSLDNGHILWYNSIMQVREDLLTPIQGNQNDYPIHT